MKRHLTLLRKVAMIAIATASLVGCEMMALDSAPTAPGDLNNGGGEAEDPITKRPIPIKPKKGSGSKIERPKLIDDLIGKILAPGSIMEYEPYEIEKPR